MKPLRLLAAATVIACAPRPLRSQADASCAEPRLLAFEDRIMGNAVGAAIEAYQIPRQWGLIYHANEEIISRPPKRMKLEARVCSFEEALDRVVALEGQYRWERDGGTYNFIPTSPPTRLDLMKQLERRVPRFEVRSVSVDRAVEILVETLNSDGKKVYQTGHVRPLTESPYELLAREYKVTLSLSGATVRECMNRIVAAHGAGHAYWEAHARKLGKISLNASYVGGIESTFPNFSESQFTHYKTLSDRLAELRGLAVVRGLSAAESAEQKTLLAEFEAIHWHARARRTLGRDLFGAEYERFIAIKKRLKEISEASLNRDLTDGEKAEASALSADLESMYKKPGQNQ